MNTIKTFSGEGWEHTVTNHLGLIAERDALADDEQAMFEWAERVRTALEEVVEAIDTARQNYGHLGGEELPQYLSEALDKARALLKESEDPE